MGLFANAVRFPSVSGTRSRRHSLPTSLNGNVPQISERTAQSLASLVTGEIIPRLVLAHGDLAPATMLAPSAGDRLDVEAFAPLTVHSETSALLTQVDRLIEAGVGVDTVMLDLLAPAARLLGRWWEEDRCGFIEVTMGLWRLQELVRELTRRFPPACVGGGGAGRDVLFASFPGEQHDFGAVMVSEMFNRHGWNSEVLIGVEMSELLAVAGGRYGNRS